MKDELKDHEKVILDEVIDASVADIEAGRIAEADETIDRLTQEQEAVPTRQVDAVLALTETVAVVFSGLLELIPPMPVAQGDVVAIQKLNHAQQTVAMGMHQLHSLLSAMGSPMVAGPPEESVPVATPASSSIVLPGQF